jgi:preprotein translocase subunit YajC
MKTDPTIYGLNPVVFVNLTILGLLVLISFLCYAIYKTLQNEKKRKKYTPTMKQGDKVHTPVMSGNVRGEILEITEDKVKMIIEVYKSRVYPNE